MSEAEVGETGTWRSRSSCRMARTLSFMIRSGSSMAKILRVTQGKRMPKSDCERCADAVA